MEPILALTTKFLGVELMPIEFRKNGMQRSVSILDVVNQEAAGVPSPVKPGEPMYMDNTGHRANPRIALAKASRNHIHAFGLDWDDDGGFNSGAYAPFEWKVA